MKLDKLCFKIDKTNAKAMIKGCLRDGKIIHQAIWCDVESNPFPMLITLNRTPTRFPMSWVGFNLYPDNYSIPYRYVAVHGEDFYIKNAMGLWNTICNNTLFDVWLPEAPYQRFAESKTDPCLFRIQLIRIWKIKETFSFEDIRHVNNRMDHLISWQKSVTLDEPIISDEIFNNIRNLLIQSIEKYRLR